MVFDPVPIFRCRAEDEFHDHAQAELLRQHGHSVILYTKSNNEIGSSRSRDLALTTLWNAETRHEVRTLLELEKPAVMHVHNTLALISPSVYSAAAELGVPVVQSMHNYRPFCLNGVLFRDGHVCEECIGAYPLARNLILLTVAAGKGEDDEGAAKTALVAADAEREIAVDVTISAARVTFGEGHTAHLDIAVMGGFFKSGIKAPMLVAGEDVEPVVALAERVGEIDVRLRVTVKVILPARVDPESLALARVFRQLPSYSRPFPVQEHGGKQGDNPV